ncbi:hypothetical protein [Kitasatospora sp. NPDC088783]|uniref:hypothetical protein n=1 Tax=Kitasatospora sp. NPDC088783 TaxID=3364077 RepID=UPI0038049F20
MNPLNLLKPRAGGSLRIGPEGTTRHELPDPLEGASEEERTFFLTHFHGQPLLEVLRRLRTAQWNADMWKKTAESAQKQLRESEAELREALAPPDRSVPPDGWKLPEAAAALLECAQDHGWTTSTAWGRRSDGDPTLTVQLLYRRTPKEVWKFDHLTWTAFGTGTSMRRLGSGLASTPRHPRWHDAPSLKRIREIIETNTAQPSESVGDDRRHRPLTASRATAVTELIGDIAPATDSLLQQLAESVRGRREHQHPVHEDWYCFNQASWAGERIGFVIRRLLDAESEAGRLHRCLADLRGSKTSRT